MRPELTSYVVIGAVAAVVTCAVVPVSIYVSRVRGLMVEPDARRMHERPTATLGGGAMYVGFLVAFLVAGLTGWFDESFVSSTEPWAILACATMAYIVGVVDDVREISPPAKIAGMLVAAGLLAIGGVSIIWFRIPFLDVFVLPYDLAFVATVIWVLGMANAVNFIDGLDGLAAGIVGIGALGFLLYGYRLGEVDLLLASNIGPLVAAIVVGISLGFLPWNVYPARVFMGDGGSLLLGSLMAASTMAVGGRTPDPFSGQTFFFYAPLAIPVVILGVPMLDTFFAILRRARNGKGLATADKDHLHHRLVRLGHGHRRSVWILWAWTALLSAFVLYPTYNDGQGDAIVPMGVGAAALVLLTLFKPGFRFRPTARTTAASTPTSSPMLPATPTVALLSAPATEPAPTAPAPATPAPQRAAPGAVPATSRPAQRPAAAPAGLASAGVASNLDRSNPERRQAAGRLARLRRQEKGWAETTARCLV